MLLSRKFAFSNELSIIDFIIFFGFLMFNFMLQKAEDFSKKFNKSVFRNFQGNIKF